MYADDAYDDDDKDNNDDGVNDNDDVIYNVYYSIYLPQ